MSSHFSITLLSILSDKTDKNSHNRLSQVITDFIDRQWLTKWRVRRLFDNTPTPKEPRTWKWIEFHHRLRKPILFPFQFAISPLSRVSCSKIQHTDPYLVLTRYHSNHYFPRCYYWQHPRAIGSTLTSSIFPFHVETNEIFSTIWPFLLPSPFLPCQSLFTVVNS